MTAYNWWSQVPNTGMSFYRGQDLEYADLQIKEKNVYIIKIFNIMLRRTKTKKEVALA